MKVYVCFVIYGYSNYIHDGCCGSPEKVFIDEERAKIWEMVMPHERRYKELEVTE
jgi:hypothetical protein